jgi:SAM-dependent methyltransferase
MLELVGVPGNFRSYRALQFSEDPTLPLDWFKSYELSIFRKYNSMDVQDIPRGDETYDIILCSHVIEHVPHHQAAIHSLVRVLTRNGFLLLVYPNPVKVAKTRDWGFPDETQHGHYRVFGRDFESEYRSIIPGVTVIAATGKDPVTGAIDLQYFITKSVFWKDRVLNTLSDARLIYN